MNQKEFYRARAAEARAQGDVATLANVRERCLRSEAAWNGMADQVERIEQLRAERLAEAEESDPAP